MIIGHIPAGYVISKLLFPRFASRDATWKPFLWAGVLGAYVPDLDMLYFHLVDHRQHHHHTYWIHFPIVWASLLLVSVIWLYADRARNSSILAIIFSLNGFIHMLLDSIVGDIWWFAPFVDKPFAFFTVPALYKPWWLNFLLHWSFALELAVVVWAVYLWCRSPTPSVCRGAQ
jgi:inner membrane protein